jgi:hypothetical protein
MSKLQRLDRMLRLDRHPREWPLAISGVLTLLAIGIVATALVTGNPTSAAIFLSVITFSLWGLHRKCDRYVGYEPASNDTSTDIASWSQTLPRRRR